MAAKSSIEWTDSSWNPIRARNTKTGKIGWHCEHATTGCEFCYAEGMNKRLGTGLPFKPGHLANGDVEIFLDETMLLAPFKWRRPRKIFVGSMTDLFARFVTDEMLDEVFAVMRQCPQHIFQVLTKRAERMMLYSRDNIHPKCWPLPNVRLGISAERQQEADERIPLLLQTPAAVRFVSLEPLLGPIDLTQIEAPDKIEGEHWTFNSLDAGDYYSQWLETGFGKPVSTGGDGPYRENRIDWVIVGGESGPYARRMNPNWARSLRDQCVAAGVPFFFKQFGEWAPFYYRDDGEPRQSFTFEDGATVHRIGKKSAGRFLDHTEHSAFPRQAT